jgi:hypothetical protein
MKIKKKTSISNNKLFIFPLIFTLLALTGTIIIVHQKQILTQNAASLNVSPLIFGTNLGLFNDGDLFLTHKVQSEVQQLHVQIIRFPIRNYLPNNIELQAAQIIKNLGITPLVTLSISAPDPVAAGRVTIQDMNQIFGNNLVYYEFGNESDLHGYRDPVKYTHYWNQVISQLKSLPVKGQFIGPVNSQSNPSYVAYFVHNAAPKPDEISWHEYTADAYTTLQQFLAGIQRWGTHIANTKAAIVANGDSVPPIFVTEWNYDSHPPYPDPRLTPQFQTQFVQAALSEFAKDGIMGAMQYDLNTNPNYNLIDGNGLTPAGQAFGQMYTQLLHHKEGESIVTLPPVSS